jgi:hypothetical protein
MKDSCSGNWDFELFALHFPLDFHDICSSITCWLDFFYTYRPKGFYLLNYCWRATSKRDLNICQIPIQNCSLTCRNLMTQKPTRIRWVNGPLANNLPLFPWRIEVVRELLSEIGQDSGYIVDERWTMLAIPSCRFNHVSFQFMNGFPYFCDTLVTPLENQGLDHPHLFILLTYQVSNCFQLKAILPTQSISRSNIGQI